LYQIVLLLESKREKALEKFSKKYISWGVYDVNYDIPSRSFHEEKIKNIDKKNAKQKIKEIDQKYKLQKENFNKIKKYWKKDKNLTALVDLYNLYANFKDWKNYYREQSSYKMKILFDEIAKRLLLTAKQVSFLTEEETTSSLEGKIKINSSEIEKRIKNSALLFLNNEMSIITDQATLNEIDNYIKTKDVLYIEGSVAYPGIVRGEAKLISSTKDFNKVKDGDVIVASTTRPDYLPFMKKSVGFITNEGGMLSHAAIMARELKKPCIIGTKIATRVLKDGDLVEVDAERGVVKILKKNNE
jgi:phosphoenolpyruvate synthase/pyruvate phosphate dikinase